MNLGPFYASLYSVPKYVNHAAFFVSSSSCG